MELESIRGTKARAITFCFTIPILNIGPLKWSTSKKSTTHANEDLRKRNVVDECMCICVCVLETNQKRTMTLTKP